MNNFFEQLKKQAREIRLTQNEKQAMRVRLYDVIKHSSLTATTPEISIPKRATPSPYFFFSPTWASAFALVLVVMLGSGTAFAAQGSLPGDPLYPVKVNINEPVQVALATSPQAKAEVNESLAEERLEEAETLASQGKLDATTSDELAVNFDAHAQAAQTIADNLQTQDPAAAAQLSTQFDSSLSAHDAILTALGDDSGSASTSEDSNALVVHVRSHEHGGNGDNGTSGDNGKGQPVLAISTGSKINTFAAINPEASTSASSTEATSTLTTTTVATTTATSTPNKGHQNKNQQTIAMGLQTNAANALATLQSDYQNVQSTLGSTTVSLIDARIALIEAAQAAGTSSLAAGDYAGASSSFAQSLRMSTQLDAFISAGSKFNNKGLLPSLLGTMNISDGEGKGSSGKGGGDFMQSRSQGNR